MRADEIAAAYDAAADGYDDRHAADPRGRRRTATLDGLLLDAVGDAAAVLDLGCGTGRLLARLRAPARAGVDVSGGMLARAVARGLPVVRGDAHALPFADASFEGVIAGKGVFRYLDPDRGFAECARVLAPGGTLALHQYGGRTVSLRGTPAAPPGTWHVARLEELLRPARRAGLTPRRVRVFRSIRIRPYLLEIPAWVDRLGVQAWNHCIAILARPR